MMSSTSEKKNDLSSKKAFKTLRDYMNPPIMNAVSCIVPPQQHFTVRPELLPILPVFYGMESENPYHHINDFKDMCLTFHEGGESIDMMGLKLFSFTLKNKAKVWFNSLRPASINTWTELQTVFLRRFFPYHRTISLRKQISNFAAKDDEKFYACWKRYMEIINACPHHGFDTYLLVKCFYDGMTLSMMQLVESMCCGGFLSKDPQEAMDFLYFVAETSWERWES